jgi:hypothetical protein
MKILVLTSCTGEKTRTADKPLTVADFSLGAQYVRFREAQLRPLVPAAQLYAGQHHLRLMKGVTFARELGLEVDLHIVSAGYGLINEHRPIAPYDITFSGMPKPQLREWADHLDLPAATTTVLNGEFDLALILLGANYLEACQIGHVGAPAMAFTGKAAGKKLSGLRVVTVGNADAKRFHCGLVGLKGEIGGRALTWLVTMGGDERITGTSRPGGLGRARPNPRRLLDAKDPLALLARVENAVIPRRRYGRHNRT